MSWIWQARQSEGSWLPSEVPGHAQCSELGAFLLRLECLGRESRRETEDEGLVPHVHADRSAADERLRVHRPAVLEHGPVERQVVRDCVAAESSEERYGPAVYRPDTD